MNKLLPYIKTILRQIPGLATFNAYANEDMIFIPFNKTNLTRMKESIQDRLKNTWIKNYISKISYRDGLVIIEFKEKNESYKLLTNLRIINEKLEKVIK